MGRPLAFTVTGGNANDCTLFTAVMQAIRVPRLGPGRPRVRPDHVIGDKGYSSKAIRGWLRRRNIRHTIPERSDQIRNRLRRGSRGGRPPAFDKQVYKRRNVVERCFNRLKQWRGIGEVDSGRPAGVSTSGFPRAASRTRRARFRAPGSPQIPLGGVQFLMP
ncbi:hypothetical protein GCM10009579_58880 [Streptomyces javensis]|uniref:Transposase IS4-like domain-containing protein n=1 Tax=Streptomyces javensis TaxID=114698 RepID=A0ABN1X6U2_9ACTN